MDLTPHLDALRRDGFTIIPDQLSRDEVADLRAITIAVRAEYARRLESGELAAVDIGLPEGYTPNVPSLGIRCMYLWHQAIERLLDHDTVHALAEQLMPGYVLNDMVANICSGGHHGYHGYKDGKKRHWHRDYEPRRRPNGNAFLWNFFLLDDFRPDNGATLVVPGTHRTSVGEGPWWVDRKHHYADDPFPTYVQALAPAGSLVVVDASMIHTSGDNRSSEDRVTLNIRLSERDAVDVVDHWQVAGDAIRRRASPRVERMLRIDNPELPDSWPFRPRDAAGDAHGTAAAHG